MIETALFVAISLQELRRLIAHCWPIARRHELPLALVVLAAPSSSRSKTRPLSKTPRQIAIHENATVVLGDTLATRAQTRRVHPAKAKPLPAGEIRQAASRKTIRADVVPQLADTLRPRYARRGCDLELHIPVGRLLHSLSDIKHRCVHIDLKPRQICVAFRRLIHISKEDFDVDTRLCCMEIAKRALAPARGCYATREQWLARNRAYD